MLYQVTSYFKFLLRSTNAHGVHSPFVYDLVTKCFYDTGSYTAYSTLDRIMRWARQNKTIVNVKDHGNGSRVFKNNSRKVGDIAKHAGITNKRQQLLFRITRYFASNRSLELGTSIGLATSAIALGNTKGVVDTVEGCPETTTIAHEIFDKFQISNILLYQKTFESFLQNDFSEPYDLVFLDGNHSEVGTLEYFNAILPYLHNDSVVILDDIYWSRGMTRAWDQLSTHSQVSVTIDTFQWGILFFRKEQPKQHFKIRV
ncbi:MAG: class I SAM-dependent methyltransferase [Flavobacteriaceae bacterium]|nr:class I SAM-dependent methyltransferase [Flavobacteriaceae bacterium]